ncbi:MAG: NAD-dependent protein deacylase [Bacilli bacterium]|nr:NAD-dependent protein deacylase [Bacilli bacterium]
MNIEIERLSHLIDISENIVFFGGAGVSTESGIKDFRSKDGLYKLHSKYGVPYEVMLSHTYFMNHTKTFYDFYREFMINKTAKPNKAHLYLAELEKRKHLTVITQNIDGLHQLAGSKNVIELHGSIHRNYCMDCHEFYNLDAISDSSGVPTCKRCGGVIKPDVVLYEEPLDGDAINNALYAISTADLIIVAGTSLSVYPASGLIRYFRGKYIVVINKDHLDINNGVTLEINRPVGEVFGELL